MSDNSHVILVMLLLLASCSILPAESLSNRGHSSQIEEFYSTIRRDDVDRFGELWPEVAKLSLNSRALVDPLLYSTRVGSFQIAGILLDGLYKDSKYDLIVKDAFFEAASNGETELMKILMGEIDNFDINIDGGKALFYALSSSHIQSAWYLIKRGVNLEYITSTNETLLHAVAVSGDVELLGFLLNAGLNPSTRNSQDYSAIDVADRLWGRDNEISTLLRSTMKRALTP